LFERDSFDLFLHEFDKPWVIHLRETCCCSTNLCTWRPNTVYVEIKVLPKNLIAPHPYRFTRGGVPEAYCPIVRCTPEEGMEKV
jgi:hypothetical protein